MVIDIADEYHRRAPSTPILRARPFRIVHHAEVITLKGNSYRLKDTLTRLASEKPENKAQ